MSLAAQYSGDITVSGGITLTGNINASSGAQLVGPTGFLNQSQIVERPLVEHVVPLTSLRVHDNFTALLPQTAATDDLAIIETTFGTDAVTVQGLDFGGMTGGGSYTAYARFQYGLPDGYVSAGDIKVRIHAAMLTSVADTSCTVDIQCYANDDAGGIGSDLCATAAQSINSLTSASYDFVITSSSRAVGDVLDIRITIAGDDSANAAVMIPEISKVAMLLDKK